MEDGGLQNLLEVKKNSLSGESGHSPFGEPWYTEIKCGDFA